VSAEEVFQGLESDAKQEGGGYVYRRVLPQSPFDVRLEVVAPTGSRRMCVSVSSPPVLETGKRTRGFVTAYTAEEGVFRIELKDVRFAPLFSALVDNFLLALAEAKPGTDPSEIVLDRLVLWQRLFEELSFDGLSDEAQRGLFAELRFLRDTLLPIVGAASAVLAWQAPDRTSKDFAHAGVAVEVKSRFKKASASVRISSEDQLDQAGFELILAVLTLDSEAHEGETLPTLVKSLRASLASSIAAISRFDDRLLRAGYLDAHEDYYGGTTYVATASYFSVRDGFPRLIRADLPPGVSHVVYDVDLAALAPFAIGLDTLRNHIRGENG
jgi:hypothetical protein